MKLISNHKLGFALTALALGIATSFPQSVSAATLYSVLDLGSLSEGSNGLSGRTFAIGINDLGQVVGTSEILGRPPQAFRTAPNQPINPLTDNIDTTIRGLSDSLSSDIDNSGQLVGTYRGRGGQRDIGFLTAPNGSIDNAAFISDRANGSLSNIDSVPFVTKATGINELGQVVGTGVVNRSIGGVGEGNYFGGLLINDANKPTLEAKQKHDFSKSNNLYGTDKQKGTLGKILKMFGQ